MYKYVLNLLSVLRIWDGTGGSAAYCGGNPCGNRFLIVIEIRAFIFYHQMIMMRSCYDASIFMYYVHTEFLESGVVRVDPGFKFGASEKHEGLVHTSTLVAVYHA